MTSAVQAKPVKSERSKLLAELRALERKLHVERCCMGTGPNASPTSTVHIALEANIDGTQVFTTTPVLSLGAESEILR